jgi:hypothetical protein
MRLIRRSVLLSVLLASWACYDYHPITQTGASSGTEVRISLTDQGSINLAPLIGPQITKVDGTLTSVADTMLVVQVSSVINRVGFSSSWNGEQLRVPKAAVSSLERRSLNRKKSWLVGGGSLAAVALAGLGFELVGGGGKGTPGGNGGGPR